MKQPVSKGRGKITPRLEKGDRLPGSGSPPGKKRKTVIREMLETETSAGVEKYVKGLPMGNWGSTYAEMVVLKMLQLSLVKDNFNATKDLLDRYFGTATQNVHQTIEDESGMMFNKDKAKQLVFRKLKEQYSESNN